MKKKIILVPTLCVGLLVCVLFINTFRFTTEQIPIEPIQPLGLDESTVAQHLSQAIRFQTISYQEPGRTSGNEFLSLHRYLALTFPRIHATLIKEVVGNYSLLYAWKGRDENLRPIVLMAHQDVVPVELGDLSKWQYPPFEGKISDGFIWGRGAMDDKQSLLAIMEAVELLLGQGFQPQRTIYLAFGDDEEIGGDNGAAKIVELLSARGVELEYVLDEGLAITEGVLPDVSKPLALIGIAEKGFVNIELRVDVESGHSSMPPRQTAIGILSAAINRLEERQMPAHIQGATRQMLEIVGPEMPFGKRLMMANLWLFGPLVERILSASPGANATVRTTTAATIIEGGLKENVLPTRARAIVNFRILPGDSIEGVISHVREVVNDPRVKVNRFGIFASEPSPVSDTDVKGFQTVQRTIRELYLDVLVAPALIVSATDSRHYVRLTNNIYRFSPMHVRTEDLERIHGINERISVQDYVGCVRFYHQLIRNSAQ